MIGNTGRGSKKSLDFDLNLTSFIDLLSTCTCFLLITAVWIQIGAIEIKQSHGTDAAAPAKDSLDLDLIFKSPSEVKINLKSNGKQTKSFEVKTNTTAEMLKKLNETIGSQIIDKKLTIATATVTPKSGVNFGDMVSALDILRKNKIVNIGVLTERGQ